MRIEVARSVASGEANVMAYGGQEYQLPATMPLDALEAMEQGQIIGFLRAVFGKAQYAKFAKEVNTDDLEGIATALSDMYGGTPGESAASGGSS